MSDQPPAAPNGRAALNALFLETLGEHNRRAGRWKQGYLWLWFVAVVPTWATLLLAIVGLILQNAQPYRDVVLYWVIPVLGGVVTVATALQTLFGVQRRWLRGRAAAERLREVAMLYRARRPPFHGPDADAALARQIEDIVTLARTGKGRHFEERVRWWHYWHLLHRPPDLRGDFAHTPDEGIEPCLGEPRWQPDLVLRGRLQNQRRWHLCRARTFALRYLGFQLGIVLVAVANAVYPYLFARAFEAVALTTACSLMLYNLRDFLGNGLLQRYVKVAGNLYEIAQAFEQRQPPFDAGDDRARLGRLVDDVERTLSSEFQYWYASRH